MPGPERRRRRNCASVCDLPAGSVPVSRLEHHAGQLLILELRMAILRGSIWFLDSEPIPALKKFEGIMALDFPWKQADTGNRPTLAESA